MRKEIKEVLLKAKINQEKKFDSFEPSFDNKLLYYEMLKSSGKLKNHEMEIFRSRFHMFTLYSKRLNWSTAKVENHYKILYTNGQVAFIKDHVEIIRDIDCSAICEIRNPNYAKSTLKIKDTKYHWDIKCQEIYNYLIASQYGIKHKYFRKEQVLTEQTLYQSPRTIAKKTGLTVNEVRYRLKNVFRSIFGRDAYHKPSLEEQCKRVHVYSRTNTIVIPQRIEMRAIFKKLLNDFGIEIERKVNSAKKKVQEIKQQVVEKVIDPISEKINDTLGILYSLEEFILNEIQVARIRSWIFRNRDLSILKQVEEVLSIYDDQDRTIDGLRKLGFKG